MKNEIKTVGWIVGNDASGLYSFRKTEPKGWAYSEPLVKKSEYDALQAEVEKLEEYVDEYREAMGNVVSRLVSSDAEVDRLRANADRYEWLKAHGSISRDVSSVWRGDEVVEQMFWTFTMDDEFPFGDGWVEVGLDDAIDAELKEQG